MGVRKLPGIPFPQITWNSRGPHKTTDFHGRLKLYLDIQGIFDPQQEVHGYKITN